MCSQSTLEKNLVTKQPDACVIDILNHVEIVPRDGVSRSLMSKDQFLKFFQHNIPLQYLGIEMLQCSCLTVYCDPASPESKHNVIQFLRKNTIYKGLRWTTKDDSRGKETHSRIEIKNLRQQERSVSFLGSGTQWGVVTDWMQTKSVTHSNPVRGQSCTSLSSNIIEYKLEMFSNFFPSHINCRAFGLSLALITILHSSA